MPSRRDISGQKFGFLTAINFYKIIGRTTYWNCVCDCGQKKKVRLGSLTTGNTVSCGCYWRQRVTAPRKHGLSNSGAYSSFTAMWSRCSDKNLKQYKDYGGRGISVCKRWRKFENFYKDMGDRPLGKTIDRIDNNKSYSPGNCRWATTEQQMNNKRNSRTFTHDGKSLALKEWAKILKAPQETLKSRIYTYKMPLSVALTSKRINRRSANQPAKQKQEK